MKLFQTPVGREPETAEKKDNGLAPICRIQQCPLGLASHGSRLCPLHKRMDAVLEQVEKTFRSTTLAEILAEPSESIPLCDFPLPAVRV